MRELNPATNHKPFIAPFLLCFFLFLFFFFSLFVRGMPPNGDPVNYFVVAESIVERGTIALKNDANVPLEKRAGDKYYSKFGIGQSLLEVPFYAVARTVAPAGDAPYRRTFHYFISELSAPFVSALACVFVLLIAAELGCGSAASLWTALAFAFATMIWPYSKIGFSEALQSCAVAASLCFALKSAVKFSAKYSALCALALGVLLLTKTVMGALAPVFFFYLILSPLPGGGTIKRRAIPFATVFAVFIAATLWHNHARFGDYLNFGYFSGKDAAFGFSTPLLSGLYGLLFSPGKSVFLYSPILILSCAFAPSFYRRQKDAAKLAFWCCALLLIIFAKWWAWHGDWAWGPRFMVPLLPFAILPLTEYFRNSKSLSALTRIAGTFVIAISFAIQILAVSVNFFEYIMIVDHQVKINAFFLPGRPDLRDDQLYLHYVTDFSPISGQWWLLKHTLAAERGDANAQPEEMKKDFPWKGLMSYAIPSDPGRGIGFDVWWKHFSRFFPDSKLWVTALLSAIAAGCVLSFIGCVVLWKRKAA